MIDADPDLASLLAVEAYRLNPADDERQALAVAARLPLERRITGHTGPVWAVAFSPDGTTLATASTARLWNAIPLPNKQIEKICNTVGRDLTSEEWSQYLPPSQHTNALSKLVQDSFYTCWLPVHRTIGSSGFTSPLAA